MAYIDLGSEAAAESALEAAAESTLNATLAHSSPTSNCGGDSGDSDVSNNSIDSNDNNDNNDCNIPGISGSNESNNSDDITYATPPPPVAGYLANIALPASEELCLLSQDSEPGWSANPRDGLVLHGLQPEKHADVPAPSISTDVASSSALSSQKPEANPLHPARQDKLPIKAIFDPPPTASTDPTKSIIVDQSATTPIDPLKPASNGPLVAARAGPSLVCTSNGLPVTALCESPTAASDGRLIAGPDGPLPFTSNDPLVPSTDTLPGIPDSPPHVTQDSPHVVAVPVHSSPTTSVEQLAAAKSPSSTTPVDISTPMDVSTLVDLPAISTSTSCRSLLKPEWTSFLTAKQNQGTGTDGVAVQPVSMNRGIATTAKESPSSRTIQHEYGGATIRYVDLGSKKRKISETKALASKENATGKIVAPAQGTIKCVSGTGNSPLELALGAAAQKPVKQEPHHRERLSAQRTSHRKNLLGREVRSARLHARQAKLPHWKTLVERIHWTAQANKVWQT